MMCAVRTTAPVEALALDGADLSGLSSGTDGGRGMKVCVSVDLLL